MSFEHAPVSKGLMLACAATSIIAGIFDIKHYLHLQLVPHISSHHQYWRLFAHHLAFSNSSDLFIAELVLWNVGVHVERQFGSLKFASFAALSTLFATILEFLALLLLHPLLGLNTLAAGPAALVFSILYQYARIVPAAYHFRVFGVPLSNKAFIYVLASQLAFTHLPPLSPLLGLLTGALYRSDLLPPSLRTYRLPLPLAAFVARWGWVGSTRAPRRLTRAVPEELLPGMGGAGGLQGGMGTGIGGVVGRAGRREARRENEEVITTAPAPAPPGSPASAAPSLPSSPTSPTPTVPITPSAPHGIAAPAQGPAQGVMRAWVSELSAAAGGRGGGGVRVPSDAEVAQVASMFPDLGRGVVVGALQRSANIEGAVETLLSAQR